MMETDEEEYSRGQKDSGLSLALYMSFEMTGNVGDELLLWLCVAPSWRSRGAAGEAGPVGDPIFLEEELIRMIFGFGEIYDIQLILNGKELLIIDDYFSKRGRINDDN